MEKRLNTKIDDHTKQFKEDIRKKAIDLGFTAETHKLSELMAYIFDYDKIAIQKDDLVKRKRIKNSIPELNRCIARRANGEQCTRRRRDDCEFCGTHSKGTPHGLIQNTMDAATSTQTMEVFVEEIKGIVFYLDKHGNVYQTEDIMNSVENPRVIARWVKQGDTYTIPELGMV
jgi:hypothetical protein